MATSKGRAKQCSSPIVKMWGSRLLKKQAGFTLIELLVVIAIIAILAAIALTQYQSFRVQAFDATAKSDLRNAMTALENYFIDENTYPAASSELEASGFSLSPNVSFTKYGLSDGGTTVHMHVQHAHSPNAWHANYPKEGSEIQIR